MKGIGFAVVAAVLSVTALAEIQIINGKKYECRDGMCMPVEDEPAEGVKLPAVGGLELPPEPADEPPVARPPAAAPSKPAVTAETTAEKKPSASTYKVRLAHGYMEADKFLAFLSGKGVPGELSFRIGPDGAVEDLPGNDGDDDMFSGKAWWLIALIALFGGLAMNLTPCVLPLVPVNLMVIGKSATRGALYGLGMTLAYGALGILAGFAGVAFGEIQGSPWFNVSVAILFAILSLSLMGVFFIDFSGRRNSLVSMRSRMFPGLFAFFMGVVGAVLAGACVAPLLISVLMLTADLVAKGHKVAFALPFILGLGMALPWPFAGAGMKVLPKPGPWMAKVNKVFGVCVMGFALWYAYLAYGGFRDRLHRDAPPSEGVVSLSSPKDMKLDGLKSPVLVDCWATWCKNCTAMEHGTLADPKVKEAVGKFTFVRVDCEDMAELKGTALFGKIKGLPAFLVIERE